MSHNTFYVVLVGRSPGIYKTWSECETQVTGLRYNAYQSFATAEEALAEFALGWVTHMVDQVTAVKPAGLDRLIRLSQDELVQRLHPYGRGRWYAVYKGRCPGVYPAWSLAVPQVIGIRNAEFLGFDGEKEASASFAGRQARGDISTLFV